MPNPGFTTPPVVSTQAESGKSTRIRKMPVMYSPSDYRNTRSNSRQTISSRKMNKNKIESSVADTTTKSADESNAVLHGDGTEPVVSKEASPASARHLNPPGYVKKGISSKDTAMAKLQKLVPETTSSPVGRFRILPTRQVKKQHCMIKPKERPRKYPLIPPEVDVPLNGSVYEEGMVWEDTPAPSTPGEARQSKGILKIVKLSKRKQDISAEIKNGKKSRVEDEETEDETEESNLSNTPKTNRTHVWFAENSHKRFFHSPQMLSRQARRQRNLAKRLNKSLDEDDPTMSTISNLELNSSNATPGSEIVQSQAETQQMSAEVVAVSFNTPPTLNALEDDSVGGIDIQNPTVGSQSCDSNGTLDEVPDVNSQLMDNLLESNLISSEEFVNSEDGNYNSLPVYPLLVDCKDPITFIIDQITHSDMDGVLKIIFDSEGIRTIGDLCQKNGVDFNRWPIKSPKYETVYNILNEYYINNEVNSSVMMRNDLETPSTSQHSNTSDEIPSTSGTTRILTSADEKDRRSPSEADTPPLGDPNTEAVTGAAVAVEGDNQKDDSCAKCLARTGILQITEGIKKLQRREYIDYVNNYTNEAPSIPPLTEKELYTRALAHVKVLSKDAQSKLISEIFLANE